MNKSSNNNVSKAQILAMTSYLGLVRNEHFMLTMSESTAEISIFVDTRIEAISLEYELVKFQPDGCTYKLEEMHNGEYFVLTYTFPMCFQKGR